MSKKTLKDDFDGLVNFGLAVSSMDYFMMGATHALLNMSDSPETIPQMVAETKAYSGKLLEQKKNGYNG